MKKIIILGVLFSIPLGIQAQNNRIENGFCIQANPPRKEVYLIDINEMQCEESPRDINNITINLKAIEDNFRKERKEMVQTIFNEEEINQLKNGPVIATVYINSKTRKIDAVSFRFRNMNKDETKSINIEKFEIYREMLKDRIIIQTLIFEKEIAKHGHVNQSFKVM